MRISKLIIMMVCWLWVAFAQAQSVETDTVSGNNVYAERAEMLMTPQYLANWVGASFFTKDNIENDLGIVPMAYNGGVVFYDLPKCNVGMEFAGAEKVCVEISFRLFGEEAYEFIDQMRAYGYVEQGSSKDLVAENNFQSLTNGRRTIYKCRLKNGGYSVCTVLEGQAVMFDFIRSKN